MTTQNFYSNRNINMEAVFSRSLYFCELAIFYHIYNMEHKGATLKEKKLYDSNLLLNLLKEFEMFKRFT